MGPFISEEILGQESIRAGADVSHAVKDLNCENLVLHKGGGGQGRCLGAKTPSSASRQSKMLLGSNCPRKCFPASAHLN